MRDSFEPINALETSLSQALGPIVGGAQLTKVLGPPTQAAFQHALTRGLVPITVFTIADRRSRFALTRDVAAWLTAVRYPQTEEGELSIGPQS